MFMRESYLRYFFGFMVTVLLLIVLIFLLFHHGGGNKTVPSTSVPLYDYSNNDSEVRMTIDGPTNANEIHQQVQVTVNQNVVTYDQIQGYEGTVVFQEQFDNNENAFNAFLRSLTIAGYTDGTSSSSLSNEQGHCPLGDRYIFELIQNGNDLERYWTTNCPNVNHSYYGELLLTMQLFEAQVPSYSTLTQNLKI